jgi:integrase
MRTPPIRPQPDSSRSIPHSVSANSSTLSTAAVNSAQLPHQSIPLAKSRGRIVLLFSQAMTEAVKAQKLASSPCMGLSLPTIERPDIRFLEPTEIITLADTMDPRYRPLVITGAFGGFRPGELLALRVGSVNPLAARIEVSETLHDEGGYLRYGPPKTKAAVRSVPVPRTGAIRNVRSVERSIGH